MIVIGYQGIGKSTLAGRDNKFIDLESGNFWVDGKRYDDWYKPYCKIAEHLSQQGYVVFVSSHEVVRNYLSKSSEVIIVAHPALELKNEWITKLHRRYADSGLEKDYKALANARDRYEENINEIIAYAGQNDLCRLQINNMSYDLEAQLISIKNTINRIY